MLRVADCIANRIRFAVSQATEWQGIADESDAATIFAVADFVNMHGRQVCWPNRLIKRRVFSFFAFMSRPLFGNECVHYRVEFGFFLSEVCVLPQAHKLGKFRRFRGL
jgi:hypothetical protein